MPAVEVSQEAMELKQALMDVLKVTDHDELRPYELDLIHDTVDYLCDVKRVSNPMARFVPGHTTYSTEDQGKIALYLGLAKRVHSKELHPKRVRALEVRLIAEMLSQMAWEQNLAASFDS